MQCNDDPVHSSECEGSSSLQINQRLSLLINRPLIGGRETKEEEEVDQEILNYLSLWMIPKI